MPNSPYVFTPDSAADGDLTTLRRDAIADALRVARKSDGGPPIEDAVVERWAQWLIEKLDAAQRIYQRSGEGWRLRTSKLHEENERRLDELAGWSDAAVAEQRKLLEHVDDPGDDGTDLEQSLSKLAAAGWSVDSKKDKKAPTVHFAAGDLPLARGEDWRAPGAIHPRFAAALAFFLGALPEAEREQPAKLAAVAERLPATAVARAEDAAALLDVRTVAKALRDVGALELASGEPLGPVVACAPFRLRSTAKKGTASPAAANGAGPAAEPAGGGNVNDVAALVATHGEDSVRFALLHAAAPAKRFRGGDDVVGYASAFLADVDKLAAARLDGSGAPERIDGDDGLRRRLAGWCDVASSRSAENYEQLDLQRATRNAVTLLARIEDFAAAVTEHRGDVTGADRDAMAVAIAVLAQLLAPLAPTVATTLWQQVGRPGALSDAAWPEGQREPAAA